MPARTGWHFHTLYRNESCPDPGTMIPIAAGVVRALSYEQSAS